MLNEDRQICLNGAPDNAITHAQVPMGEQVMKVDDPSPFRNGRKQPRIPLGNHFQSLANGDEFPLCSGADEPVPAGGAFLLEAPSSGPAVAAAMAVAASRMSLR